MECQIRKHDDRQFEVKVAYPLERGAAGDRYELDLFVFLPYQLGVNASTYSPAQFYEDLRSYTRFKTPALSLDEVNDARNELSPLTRVEQHVESGRRTGRWDERRLQYELRVLANVVIARVRERTLGILQRRSRRASPVEAAGAAASVAKLLEELGTTLQRIRELRPALQDASTPPALHEAHEFMDEYVSIEAEGSYLRLLKFVQEALGNARAEENAQLAAAIRGETRHRHECGYPSLVSRDAKRNERFLYRRGLLKKFCGSVLFLSEEPTPAPERVRQVLYAVAAALAMTFAVVAAWLAGLSFRQNTFGFAAVAIIAYAFKDRIKDFLRDCGVRLLPAWTSDRSIQLADPQYGEVVGRTRENLFWRNRAGVPDDVLKAGQYPGALERAVVEPTDVILHYAKKVRINTGVIYRSHERSIAIDEFLRMQVGRWLRRMDDPRTKLLALEGAGDSLASVRAARVYRVPLVLRMTACRDGSVTLLKAALVLSRKGIERIET